MVLSIVVGVHHSSDMSSNFKYTHPPLNVAKKATSVTAHAFHKLTNEYPNPKGKMVLYRKWSPKTLSNKSTEAPIDACELKKREMSTTIIHNMP